MEILLSDNLFDLEFREPGLEVSWACVYRPVQLQSGFSHDEHPDHEGDEELDDEDDPARHHVVRVGDHLLHAPQGGPDVDVEGLCREKPQHTGQDITLGWKTKNHNDRVNDPLCISPDPSPWDGEHGVLQTKWYGSETGQHHEFEGLLAWDDAQQGPDILGLLEQRLDVACQDVLGENGGHYTWSVVTSDDHLAENVGDNDPDGGGDHGHSYAVQQPVHVATGQINHNVALEKGSGF